jgi:hypothetical protein
MLGRFRRNDGDRVETRDGERGGVATRERPVERDEAVRDEPVTRDEAPVTRTERRAAPLPAHDAIHARQRSEFGGFSWGADFFGWLAAIGLAALLIAIVAAAGAATGLTNDVDQVDNETIGLGGGIAVLVVLAIAYYAGGYVAGRMARFDGARQGLGVWIVGLVMTALLGVAGAALGSQYNVFSQLNLPRIPIDEGTLTTGGVIALIAAVLVTVFAAVLGGKAGVRFHRKVDRVGYDRI